MGESAGPEMEQAKTPRGSKRKAAGKAAEMVQLAIHDAGEKILEATGEAIQATGDENAVFFDQNSLRDKLANPDR